MMNGEGPSVPITTLAGIQSLTDLLLELPLPTPLPGFTGHQSLLSHLRDPEEARRLLNTQESIIAPTLVETLNCTTTDHIEVKDGYYGGTSQSGQISQFVEFLTGLKPGLFKGTVQNASNMASDHHPNSPWMQQRPCSASVVHQQQQPQMPPYSGSAAISPCTPHSSQANSPGYFPVDHQASMQGNRLMHNKNVNATQPKSPGSAYSPYAHPVTSSNQQHLSLHHNAVPHTAGDALSSGLQKSPQLFSPPSVSQHVSNANSQVLHPFSNGNCVDSVPTGLSVVKPNRTENHVADALQPSISSVSSNCSPFSLNQTILNDASLSSPSSSSSTPHHVNSSSVIVAHVNNSSRTITTDQPTSNMTASTPPTAAAAILTNCQSSENSNQSEKSSKSSVAGISPVHPSISNDKTNVTKAKPTPNMSLTKSSLSQKASIEPVVILSKLTDEDQALAQKSVRQFISQKNQKPNSRSPGRNRNMDSTDKRQRTSVSGDTSKSSPRRKVKNNEWIPNRKNSDIARERGVKRSYEGSDDEDFISNKVKKEAPLFFTKRIKKRRGGQQTNYIESSGSEAAASGDDVDDDFKVENTTANSQLKTKKSSKRSKKDVPQLSIEDLMDTNTYQHFSRTVEAIFDAMEDIDFSAAVEDDVECPAEALIPLPQLHDLCNEAAKLKMLKAMNQFPPERLTRLLSILERNIMDGAKLLPIQNMDEQDEDEAKLWLELAMERVMRSADSSLTALYIMTSPKMPEKVFLEDAIERIVLFLKFQLQNTVFPVFDPAYRLDPKSKDGYAGSFKQKRAHASKVKEKSAIQLYNKLHESVSLLAELLDTQTLTDTIILQVSTLGVSPFFVEGVSELQLNALRLVTSVFAQYDKHRQLILEDILASIARLPTSKRSLRNYRLNSEENIQMLTALVLQLIHSVVRLPEPEEPKSEYSLKDEPEKQSDKESKDKVHIDKDVLITTSYDAALRTAFNFLSVFLKKCGTKNEEMDYRPLFENFVQDLLSTVNKPEWPASELLLNVLGRMLVQHFSNKSSEMALRVASLDYLGVVAARLRKDAVTSQLRKEIIDDVIQRLIEEEEEAEITTKGKKSKKKSKPDEMQVLQRALLQYLDANTVSEPALQFSRKFYIAQWYRDATSQIKKPDKLSSPTKASAVEKEESQRSKAKHGKQSPRTRRRSSHVTYEEEEQEEEEEEEQREEEIKLEGDEIDAKVLALAEERKRFLLEVVKKPPATKATMKKDHIDYETAELIARFLASKRHFSQSFDLYLSQILRVLSETAVAVRTKAMKCLTLVVEADPSILARPDMQLGVHGRLLDHSTSVREAAVDLVGRFILIRPELTSQYYQMLTDRILDTGVSVRKRVIKILKDVCIEQPDFPKTPEICVKIIRRVNDEEGIKKLVGEVFQSMWFSPVSDRNPDRILQKVRNITHVVEASSDTGLEWFEQLLTNLLKNKDDSNYKSVVKACQQIVNCLVENVLRLEESSHTADGGASSHLVACLSTLHLFSKIFPPFVVPHATTIQPYLSMKCNTASDYRVLNNVAQTLELVVPLIEHPSESFLMQIEEDMVKLILRQGMMLLQSCISCLGAIVNRVTHNYQLVRDCFQKFLVVLLGFKKEHEKNSENPLLKAQRPRLLRALCTVGLFCRHFDFDTIDSKVKDPNVQESLKDKVFEGIIYFNNHEDEDIRLKALIGLGFMMIRHYEFMLGPAVKNLYHYLLTSPMSSSALKCQVLKNLSLYLIEEETRMIQQDAEWSKTSKTEDLKEMGDVTSGMASTVIQIYLKQILDSVLHTEISVRKVCLQVIQLIFGQGLVHPVQIVPYLVCLGSDGDQVVRTKSDQLLQEIEKKYPGFIQMKAISGVRMSFKMQQLVQSQERTIRGFRQSDNPASRNGFLYSVIRGTRQSRRAFLFSLMKLYDEQAKTPLTELLYIADNIVYFPYMAQDEPLFIMHQIDIMLSVCGSNLLQSFHEALLPKRIEGALENENIPAECDDFDDDDDDHDSIMARIPENTQALQECIVASQGCILLLFIKQTLKEMYGFTDNKIQQYSPNESAKVYERPLNRKAHVRFNPTTVVEFIEGGSLQGSLDSKSKEVLITQYLNFKQLMLTIDPSEDDEEEEGNQPKYTATTVPAAAMPVKTDPEQVKSEGTNVQQPPLEKTRIVITQKSKSPSHSRQHKKTAKPPKDKSKKKHKKKRKRVIDSASDNSDSDPDFMDSS